LGEAGIEWGTKEKIGQSRSGKDTSGMSMTEGKHDRGGMGECLKRTAFGKQSEE